MDGLFKKIIKTEDLQIYRLKDVSFEPKRKGRKLKEEVIYLPINDTDKYLLKVAKKMINQAGITNKQLYDRLGYSVGYGLLYDLTKENAGISWERLMMWADILDFNIEVTVNVKEDNSEN